MQNLTSKIVIAISVFFILACSESQNIQSQTSNTGNYLEFISKIKLPESLEWCGEKVPLDDPEVKERAERELYMLLQQPGQIILYLKRSGKYFPLIERILKENNAPDDLKYLAIAESALMMARSNKGAIGFWQFIPETAKKMGLIVNDNVDERRNVEKSTIAAIKYLKEGYSSTKSWYLAAAGYNMGHDGITDNINFQKSNNYFDLFLNEETSRYCFRIIIIKEILAHPEKYGFKVNSNELYSQEKSKIVKWTKAIPDLSQWAIEHKSNYKQIKLLNPWMLERKLQAPERGSYDILVPVE